MELELENTELAAPRLEIDNKKTIKIPIKIFLMLSTPDRKPGIFWANITPYTHWIVTLLPINNLISKLKKL